MATKELQELRHKYKVAYTAYMHSVSELSDASQKGEWLPAEVVTLEERSFNELALLRKALLDALYAHAMKGDGAVDSQAGPHL